MRSLAALFLVGWTLTAPADVGVLTQHNDNGRTGMNLAETALTTANVNTNSFGLLYTRPVDDQIYAQPLVMTNVNLGANGVHNLLIVCTVNDTVYAYDADDPTVIAPYWTNSFISPPNIVAPLNTDMTGACGGGYTDFAGRIGIVSTPVIDPVAGTLYLVARTKENGTNFVQRLHALDLTTGLDRPNSPAILLPTCQGTASDSDSNGVITFDPQRGNQRPGLLLLNAVVYVGWSSHCDWDPYHGWLAGYDAVTLTNIYVFNDTPNGSRGGIWMSGQGPSADANGNLYLSTGNGSFDGQTDFGQCFVKLTPGGTNLAVTSWFSPNNWSTLNDEDLDLGSAGLLLIPGTTLAWSGGKAGTVYLVDRDNMGFVSNGTVDTNVVQSWSTGDNEIHGGPVWWDGPGGSYAYLWPGAGYLMQYQFDRTNLVFNTEPVYQSANPAPFGEPGGIMAVTANGTNAGTGIVWAAHQLSGDAEAGTRPGLLQAFDASNVGQELWDSQQMSARDGVGYFAKFVAPTIANGKVYLATFSGQVDVYGLLPRPALTVSISGGNAVLAWPTNGFPGFNLQTNADLGTTNWSSDQHAVVTTNGNYQVTIPMAAGAIFYRLMR